jgi:predicted TPR repeat methyltransferase
MYEASSDPWSFGTDAYEHARYQHLLSCLGDDTFHAAFEPGCSIGVLTTLLAPRCRRLLAIDISAVAAARARTRCARFRQVEVRQGALPDDVPAETFDLAVLSEIGYYFAAPVLTGIVGRLSEHLVPGALVVAAHWTGTSADHVLTGRQVHDILDGHPTLRLEHADERPSYLLSTYRRTHIS